MQQDKLQNRTLVEELNHFCTKERERIYNRHQFGIGGKEIVEEYTRLADNVIKRIYHAAIQTDILPEDTPMTILALGGYGRQALNPYSDIDIMLVYKNSQVSAEELRPFASQLISTLWDVGFEVGHSCRSIKECIRATYQDIFSKTSMIEARAIAGDKTVYRQFQRQTSKHVFRRKVSRFIAQTIHEWNERHESYGSTIYLQEPNVKESVGALRDFHTAIWVAAVRYRVKELQGLWKRGIIPESVSDACEASLDFLWRLRNELHYLAQRRNDQLTFEVQGTVANNLGYEDESDMFAEELMMRDYYLHAENLYEFANLIIESVKYRKLSANSLINRLGAKTLPNGFMVVRNEICFQPGRSDFHSSPNRMIKVFAHRQQLGYRISAEIRHQIVKRLNLINDSFRASEHNATDFRSILRHGERVAETLRCMHRWQVLDRYLPELGAIRSLVKCDPPHRYTVDEHTMYAIENLEGATLAQLKDGEAFVEILKSIEQPGLLRLAVLLHDVGKGIAGPGTHDDRSVEAAKAVLTRLQIEGDDAEIVLFLIAKHLDMSHIARQRDLDDPKVIQRFAELVEDEQHLKMLYLLTFADMRAVNETIWTRWNATLLRELYTRTLKFLQGNTDQMRLDELHEEVNRLIGDVVGEGEISLHFQTMPEHALISNRPEFISKQIQLIKQLGDAPIAVSCFGEGQTNTQIGICTRDARGIFRRITGTLAAENINILRAEIDTRSDGIVIDVLNITDGKTKEGATAERCHQIAETLMDVWEAQDDIESGLHQKIQQTASSPAPRRNISTEIYIDNDGSDRATIIDIRVPDRVGLLYTISDQFYQLGLDICIAKISTEKFWAIDSFYVTEKDGTKITHPERIKTVQQTLAARLES